MRAYGPPSRPCPVKDAGSCLALLLTSSLVAVTVSRTFVGDERDFYTKSRAGGDCNAHHRWIPPRGCPGWDLLPVGGVDSWASGLGRHLVRRQVPPPQRHLGWDRSVRPLRDTSRRSSRGRSPTWHLPGHQDPGGVLIRLHSSVGVERGFPKPEVAGSSPAGDTNSWYDGRVRNALATIVLVTMLVPVIVVAQESPPDVGVSSWDNYMWEFADDW